MPPYPKTAHQPSQQGMRSSASDTAPNCISQSPRFQEANLYRGNGTKDSPFIVEWLENDVQNPQQFSSFRKWGLTAIVTLSTFIVTLTSSAYSASAGQISQEFHCSSETFNAGVSLYVFGFALGPALWAPLSELYGRRIIFATTQGIATVFIGATAGAKNIQSILVFRFLTGMYGAAPLTNAGGVITDLFPAAQRGLALSLFATAPFLGPTLGPIAGGFIAIHIGWRWVQGVCCILSGLVWILLILVVPETYGPRILRETAAKLSKEAGKFYISVLESENQNHLKPVTVFSRALCRPWVMLFREPIVLIASIYMAILYGTLYMFFPAFPIVYGKLRGWNAGVSSLPFLGLSIGMILGLAFVILDDRYRFQKLGCKATPESRLPPAMIGAVFLPVGLFAFAWTNSPATHWIVSVVLCVPFAFGTVPVFISLFNYQLDSYAIYAASVLAAGAILRSLVGGAFPLFTTQLYEAAGVHWASSIPAFLTILCLPFPFVMYRYGEIIRRKCRIAAEVTELMDRMKAK